MKTTSSACLILALSFHAFASERSIADQQKQYQDHLDWAKGAQQTIPEKAKDQLNLNDYCDSAECINQVRNPPQKGLNDATIKQQKAREFLADETANAVKSQFDKGRPDIKSDPATRFALLGQEQAYAITHGISNAYVDCNSGTQCQTENHQRRCAQPTQTPVICHETPVVDKQEITTGSVSFRYNGFTPVRYTLPAGVNEITGITFPSVLTCQGMRCLPSINNGVKFRVNGVIVHTKPYKVMSVPHHLRARCIKSGSGHWCLNQYPSFHQSMGVGTSGNVTIDMVNDIGLYTGTFTIHYRARTNVMKWQSDCATLLPECERVQRQCIEGAGTRVINGVRTYLSCWKYQLRYQCNFPDTCAELADNCTTTSSRCKTLQNGVCVEKEYTKTCPVKTCSTTKLHCLDTTFCLDGDCYGATPTQSDDFAKSAAGLAALSEAAKGLGNPPRIFAGQGMQCTDKAFGFADCCKDSGWGTDIGLAKCSEQEKALGQAKEQGLTIALGSYCATKVLGACVRKKKGYCVFGSKLARIVQAEGARDQLGLSFGSAEHPKCEALTPEQLQAIRFDRIDFSDFFDDMRGNAQLPSAEEIQERLRSAYGE
ncbi:type-F conjugative transfer system mating-pair stabilization protein TraN [Vibrio brasiliensis]|uniref:type-F conjugative transfer system mating-pair stabilization protein TraN n=1 Tax=Vibrio brasiliensis TaxID=170652 RepID=UPI001EFE3543|nr:type-F conjugative transfer system mating-pair stabilization protein TraN [Vibrio brasiliensis]MCG9784518.1 type-F conjugative transfer system mating-pair stabilization protein TraN [Vibrio brasiliensis]